MPPLHFLKIGAAAIGAFALGAAAIGALGALAIGRLAVRSLAIREGRLASLHMGDLAIGRLTVGELIVTDAAPIPHSARANRLGPKTHAGQSFDCDSGSRSLKTLRAILSSLREF
jgi:hypothetical protein